MATQARILPDGDLSIGRVFALVVATMRRNAVTMLTLAILFGTVPTMASAYAMSLLLDAQGDVFQFSAEAWALFALAMIVATAVSILPQAALTRAVAAEAEGRRASLAEGLKAGVSVILPLLGLGIVYALGTLSGLALLIVPGAMLMTAWAVCAPVMVEERRGIIGSLKRSQELTQGFRWKIFGLLLIFYAAYSAQQVAVGWVSGDVESSSLTAAYSNPSYLATSIVAETLLAFFWCSVVAALYVELRNARDGMGTASLEQVFA